VFSLKELIHCVNTVEVDGMVECNLEFRDLGSTLKVSEVAYKKKFEKKSSIE
jgi:hypothetical protein